MREENIIQSIDQLIKIDNEKLVKGIGDDCAVVKSGNGYGWLVTMDTLVEDVHFNRSWHAPELLGRKTVSVNVSDIAAMGGRPLFILLSAGLPPSFNKEWFDAFSQGLVDACSHYDCILVGGDTVTNPGGYSFTITAIGEAALGNIVYRDGAQIGDDIWVSGTLGDAAAGLELFRMGGSFEEKEFEELVQAHLNPIAQTILGIKLGNSKVVNSMMDLSDGIATDLARLCDISKVKAEVYAENLPFRSSFGSAATLLDMDPIQLALSGGEDYQLLFTVRDSMRSKIKKIGEEIQVPLTRIGKITEGSGVILLPSKKLSGSCGKEIQYQGFDHFSD